jgi:hypothetical protein
MAASPAATPGLAAELRQPIADQLVAARAVGGRQQPAGRVAREQQLLRDGGGGVDDLAAEVPPLPRLQLLCALPKARLR